MEKQRTEQGMYSIEKTVDLKNKEVVDQVKQELHTEDVISTIDMQADELEKDSFDKVGLNEKPSFWGTIETQEEKIVKIETLFKELDIVELQREDTETSARGWNVTHNSTEIEKFKKDLIDSFAKKNNYRVRELPNFEKLISQKSYQDIVWATTSISPEVFDRYNANEKFNTFIQERPEFLESLEVKKVYLSHLKRGIKDGTLFEGYIHTPSLNEGKIPDVKKDYLKKDDDWSMDSKDSNVFIKENEGKSKRIKIPNSDKEFIINLDQYEFDSSQIDLLNREEKEELREKFIEKIESNMYGYYGSEKTFADEIIAVGEKLGVTKDIVNAEVFTAMMHGIVNGNPPAHGIDKEFTEVDKNIQETLSNPEKRREILISLHANVTQKDSYFDTWRGSRFYIRLNQEEEEGLHNAYLDFSSGKILQEKQNYIFGHSWSNDIELYFSQADRIKAFESMNSEQRSRIALTYKGSMDKINYLNFTTDDILAYAVNSLENQHNVWKGDVEQVQKKIQENFPGSTIDDVTIIKKAIFKNIKSIGNIQQALERNNIPFSPKEILENFESLEEFVREQIKGGIRYNLSVFEDFRNNPETPLLTVSNRELFDEIKQNILDNQFMFSGNRDELKGLLKFVPKEYTIAMMTDEKLQSCFSDFYKKSLKEGSIKFANDLRFVIPKSETLINAESQAFEEYIKEGDLFNLSKLHRSINETHYGSPTLKNIEQFFSQKLIEYGYVFEGRLSSNNLQDVIKDCANQKLHELTPEKIHDKNQITEWFNLKYGDKSPKMLEVYGMVQNFKNFTFFEEKISPLLSYGKKSDQFVNLLSNNVEAKDIDRILEFDKDISSLFSNNSSTIEENWNYLYSKVGSLHPVEYKENVDILKEISPLVYSRTVRNMSFENIVDTLYPYMSVSTTEEKQKILSFFDVKNYAAEQADLRTWAQNIIVYVDETEENNFLPKGTDRKEQIANLFSGEYKNVALSEMSKEWKDFLSSDIKTLPPQLFFVSKLIDEAGGAGNMKHIESLGNLSHQIQTALEKTTTSNTTSLEIKNLLASQEDRFTKEKWSQDEISEFYNLSTDIIEAAPSLYTSFAPIFENISSKDMKKFMSDIFPFYQTQLVVMQNIEGERTSYNSKNLVEMRQSIKEFSSNIQNNEGDSAPMFESEKLRLLEIAKTGFKERFGLLKVPENFTKENLRSIQNTIRYMGNINSRTPEREALISLYLGLELDSKWGEFRGGTAIDFGEYLKEEQLNTIKPLLEEKQQNYTILADALKISLDKMPKFQEILQSEVSNNLIGNIQTIDVKLGNIKRNVDDLIDPDLYQTQKEKDVLSLFLKEGKNVSATLAKIYGISAGKNIQLSENEEVAKQRIESIFGIQNWTPDIVKKIQDEVQPMGLVMNMIHKMQEEKIDENIQELQNRLLPNNEIITIFNKLGEEFHPESGALALSKDLSYLENIIVKDEGKITKEEKELIVNYIESIREKMKDLETVSDHIKQYFDKLKKSSHLENNSILKNRISEIEKIVYSTDTSSVITSQMTKDLNLVIENMRQCLGCMRKEANNDTNLSFGDYNKFFMMNKSEKEKGSISDEIVFFVPVTTPDGKQEMSFVMDQVYGSKSADVLVGNISAVHKKYQALKKEFPESNLSISITSSAMKSVGLSSEILEKRLQEILGNKVITESFEELVATIPQSSLGDNYVEFGDGTARQSGDRQFSGVILK